MTAFVIQTAIFVVALISIVRFFIARFEAAEHNWCQERSLLLTRIQHPERVVTQTREDWKPPRPRVDQIDRVGRIDMNATPPESDAK